MEVKKPIFTVCGTPTYVAPEILEEKGVHNSDFKLRAHYCTGERDKRERRPLII